MRQIFYIDGIPTSKNNYGIIKASEKGYKIKDNCLFNPKGNMLTGGRDKDGYHFFSFVLGSLRFNIRCHRLLAYEKYGEKMFEKGIVVRHLNNINTDNSWDNVVIGTVRENEMDKPLELRRRVAAQIAQPGRKYTDYFIQEVRAERASSGMSYEKLAKKFNLPTPSVAYLIVNNNYITISPDKLII